MAEMERRIAAHRRLRGPALGDRQAVAEGLGGEVRVVADVGLDQQVGRARDQPPAELERKLHPWLRGSIAMLILTGVPMFLSEAIKCYYSPPFWYKIGALILAIIFTFTLRRRAAARAVDKAPVIALASIALWMGVAFAGRWIAFY